MIPSSRQCYYVRHTGRRKRLTIPVVSPRRDFAHEQIDIDTFFDIKSIAHDDWIQTGLLELDITQLQKCVRGIRQVRAIESPLVVQGRQARRSHSEKGGCSFEQRLTLRLGYDSKRCHN